MEKYLPQTKWERFWGYGKQVNPDWLENLRAEKEKSLSNTTSEMNLKYCCIVNKLCILDVCVHFKGGQVSRTLSSWGYYHITKPICKLWSK